jgi:hypothetical protein
LSAAGSAATADLPASAARALDDFVQACRESFGDRLRAVVLYGSGAEGRMRPTSDLNVMVVLRSFSQAEVDRLREPLRVAQAAARLAPMFLLEDEIPEAIQAFAAKFADMLHRRRVVHGDDPFTGVSIPREAEIGRLKQVLLNLALRLRALYALRSLREEQLALVVADAAGPLRSRRRSSRRSPSASGARSRPLATPPWWRPPRRWRRPSSVTDCFPTTR